MTAPPTMEFHVSRAARDRYGFDDALFTLTGSVLLADYAAARRFAQRMNERRDLVTDPGSAVRAGDINAMGLIHEVLHGVVQLYKRERNAHAMAEALDALGERLSEPALEDTLTAFAEHFPPLQAYRGELSAEAYLGGDTNGTPNREIVLEELLLLWLANVNPGFAPHAELFDDQPLEEGSAYSAVIEGLADWFRSQPGLATGGDTGEDLISVLRKPAVEGGASLAEQLRWISERWGFAAERIGDRLTISLDVLAEDERAEWMRFHATQGGADDRAGENRFESAALEGFAGDGGAGAGDPEVENFSLDLDWMPRVVLLAKSTYVWLDQLSRQYGRPILRLDQIPDEELNTIAARGFTGLWLIGLWERSRASREIKQRRGNPEAVASAYSLMDYRISEDLGGEDAYANLRDRAWSRGIRLASDMVPNHMGIDSRWVVDHPDWFMQRDDSPYPVYTFNGPNLSDDERVGIYLEDHYYDNSDAAVVFKRVDRWNGHERYIYHGNDGTSMPWNDTAQLDYLKPDVREAVIQTILAVARRFPIIRFDAAMTLAKRHVQRLWYPEPGTAGAIPSRAEYAMTKAAFDRAMPQEFWREVVDRVAEEAPDTLLLAEAFWLMEGYFVRTLGMHRVYNSAFMHMMRDERNAEYRTLIKNTLEFDPQILKRYVNFMNNPDERTAVDQFGSGDKYFGVATVLTTMPGLPMFGHGQVEGYAERYGMEYRRAYVDETADAGLIARHEREIFPLVHRRALFAEVEDFALYDFVDADGRVDENVLAYSNRRDGVRSLVVYNNRAGDARGWIRTAAVTGRSLADMLGTGQAADEFLVMRDERQGLSYVRSHADLAQTGLYLELGAYGCQAFLDLADVHDADGRYARLAAHLSGRGVASIEEALQGLELSPLHEALRDVLVRGASAASDADVAGSVSRVRAEVARLAQVPEATVAIEPDLVIARGDAAGGFTASSGGRLKPADMTPQRAEQAVALHQVWRLARAIDGSLVAAAPALAHGRWIDEWQVAPVLVDALRHMRDGVVAEDAARQLPDIISVLLSGVVADGGEPVSPDGNGASLLSWLDDPRVRRAIAANEHEGTVWFNRERFERMIDWLQVPDIERHPRSLKPMRRAQKLVDAAEQAGYRLVELQKLFVPPPEWASTRPVRRVAPARGRAPARGAGAPVANKTPRG